MNELSSFSSASNSTFFLSTSLNFFSRSIICFPTSPLFALSWNDLAFLISSISSFSSSSLSLFTLSTRLTTASFFWKNSLTFFVMIFTFATFFCFCDILLSILSCSSSTFLSCSLLLSIRGSMIAFSSSTLCFISSMSMLSLSMWSSEFLIALSSSATFFSIKPIMLFNSTSLLLNIFSLSSMDWASSLSFASSSFSLLMPAASSWYFFCYLSTCLASSSIFSLASSFCSSRSEEHTSDLQSQFHLV